MSTDSDSRKEISEAYDTYYILHITWYIAIIAV